MPSNPELMRALLDLNQTNYPRLSESVFTREFLQHVPRPSQFPIRDDSVEWTGPSVLAHGLTEDGRNYRFRVSDGRGNHLMFHVPERDLRTQVIGVIGEMSAWLRTYLEQAWYRSRGEQINLSGVAIANREQITAERVALNDARRQAILDRENTTRLERSLMATERDLMLARRDWDITYTAERPKPTTLENHVANEWEA